MPELGNLGGFPNWSQLVVLAWTLQAGYERGIVWAFVGGILQDLISAVPLGPTSLALVIVTSLAALIVGQISPRNWITHPDLAALGRRAGRSSGVPGRPFSWPDGLSP
jgi:rod shape-determining protein MreD